MGLLNALFGNSANQLTEYLAKDAIILDVRTKSEHQSNHIKSAMHIPLQELDNRVHEIKKLNKPVIAHCASGIRSAKATQFLKSNGIDAINGGGINSLRKKL